ncbi:MAG: hypothetical protein E7360_03915 [Clostridiales bacterium]|nr:hypothetical protein [Clostridiales bacterium]
MQNEQLVAKLKDKRLRVRLKSLKALLLNSGKEENPIERDNKANVNNVFRTVYSCFDRTATFSVYYANKFDMPLTAVVDYASLSSAEELIKAEKLTGGLYYVGAEVYAKNGDNQKVVMSAIGVPHSNIKSFNDELATYRNNRLAYTNSLREKLNSKFKKYSLSLPVDFWSFFGAIKTTSLEDLYVNLADKIIKKFISGDKIIEFLSNELGFELTEDETKKLEDVSNLLYVVDLAYALFNHLKIKLPDENLKNAIHFISLCQKYGAISSLIYRGGDLNAFIETAKSLKVNSATMPFTKATEPLMDEFYDKCLDNGILPLVRTVISHPRHLMDGVFKDEETAKKFNETAYCVVGHEISSSINPDDGMFTDSTSKKFPTLEERIKIFSRIKKA